jgi:hypothetical protein
VADSSKQSYETSEFHKNGIFSRPSKGLSASHEGLCSRDLVTLLAGEVGGAVFEGMSHVTESESAGLLLVALNN